MWQCLATLKNKIDQAWHKNDKNGKPNDKTYRLQKNLETFSFSCRFLFVIFVNSRKHDEQWQKMINKWQHIRSMAKWETNHKKMAILQVAKLYFSRNIVHFCHFYHMCQKNDEISPGRYYVGIFFGGIFFLVVQAPFLGFSHLLHFVAKISHSHWSSISQRFQDSFPWFLLGFPSFSLVCPWFSSIFLWFSSISMVFFNCSMVFGDCSMVFFHFSMVFFNVSMVFKLCMVFIQFSLVFICCSRVCIDLYMVFIVFSEVFIYFWKYTMCKL